MGVGESLFLPFGNAHKVSVTLKNSITCLLGTILCLIYFRNIELHLDKADSNRVFYFTCLGTSVTLNMSVLYILFT